MQFHEGCIMPDVECRGWSPDMLGVTYCTRLIEVAMLRVDHVVAILKETAVGVVGGMLLIQCSRVIEDVVRIEPEVLTPHILWPVQKHEWKARPRFSISKIKGMPDKTYSYDIIIVKCQPHTTLQWCLHSGGVMDAVNLSNLRDMPLQLLVSNNINTSVYPKPYQSSCQVQPTEELFNHWLVAHCQDFTHWLGRGLMMADSVCLFSSSYGALSFCEASYSSLLPATMV
jgi:hypothetical protein